MASNQQIISDLRLIKETEHELELLATYKGVPFICKARIEHIDDDLVRIKTADPAMVCLEKDMHTRVLGSDYFEPALAQIASLDIAKGIIELSNFSYLGTKLGERMIVRVEPKTPVEIGIEAEGQSISGELADISLSGLGALVKDSEYSAVLKPSTIITLNLHLPNGQVSIAGLILSVTRKEDCLRLAIRFVQNGSAKMVIFKYLVDRRAEITEEIKAEYRRAAKAGGS
jgi:hypothetical protein